MKLETQVVSLELAKKLKELEVKQESYFCWFKLDDREEWGVISNELWNNCQHIPENDIYYSAFTVAELGEMLHDIDHDFVINSFSSGDKIEWCVTLSNKIEHIEANSKKAAIGITEVYHHDHVEIEDTEADARAKMLIYLLENKLITL